MSMFRSVYEVTGYVAHDDEWCVPCARKQYPGLWADEVHPIFLGSEYDCVPVCARCFEAIDCTMVAGS